MSWGKRDTPIGHTGSSSASGEARLFDFASRRYSLLASAVLLLAAFNLTYRLGLESVEEWDESLYATTAWEMLQSGDLIGTTFGRAGLLQQQASTERVAHRGHVHHVRREPGVAAHRVRDGSVAHGAGLRSE